jgi:hypothetical protein
MFFTNCIASKEVSHTNKYIGFDKFELTLLWISILGLLFAWKNEIVGGLLILVPSLVLMAIRPPMIMSGIMLLPAFGFMFLYCHWRSRTDNIEEGK